MNLVAYPCISVLLWFWEDRNDASVVDGSFKISAVCSLSADLLAYLGPTARERQIRWWSCSQNLPHSASVASTVHCAQNNFTPVAFDSFQPGVDVDVLNMVPSHHVPHPHTSLRAKDKGMGSNVDKHIGILVGPLHNTPLLQVQGPNGVPSRTVLCLPVPALNDATAHGHNHLWPKPELENMSKGGTSCRLL